MTKKEMITLFHRSIIKDTKAATELINLLTLIRGACINMNGAELNEANEKVIAVVETLRKNHLIRLKIVDAFGFGQKIQAFIDSLPANMSKELSEKLIKLIAALKECEEKNKDNGQLFSGQSEVISKLSEGSMSIRI